MARTDRTVRCRSQRRTLVYFPVIHTEADMGRLGESVRLAAIQKLGGKRWRNRLGAIREMWVQIERVIGGLTVPCESIRLYQDGLPVCGREEELVRELAKAGSPNHCLLLGLMEKGARIMGTESSELLVEEYGLVKRMLEAREAGENESRLKSVSGSLLKRRDGYIANRINTTLGRGETGIVFLGMLHCIEHLLDEDIRVVYPLNKPLHHRSKGDDRGL